MEKIVFMLPSIKTSGGNRVVIELANQLIIKNKIYKYGTNFLSNAVYLISIFRFKGLK